MNCMNIDYEYEYRERSFKESTLGALPRNGELNGATASLDTENVTMSLSLLLLCLRCPIDGDDFEDTNEAAVVIVARVSTTNTTNTTTYEQSIRSFKGFVLNYTSSPLFLLVFSQCF